MNNTIDEWLNQFEESLRATPAGPNIQQAETAEGTSGHSEVQSVPEPASATIRLSDDDFDSLLSDLGFVEAQETEAEEITEDGGGSGEEGVNTEGALEAVRSVNGEDYPDENPDVDNVSRAIQELDDMYTENGEEGRDLLAEVPTVHESPQEPLITPNSPTLLLDESTSRFSGAEWYEEIKKQRVILAGLGGIGSMLAIQLARMSIASLVLYDDDIVEMANMSGQFYGQSDVGQYKADAILNAIQNYTTTRNILAIRERFTSSTEAGNIMICGFDNMEARKTFFNSWKTRVECLPEREREKCLFIDGRLSIGVLQVLCTRGDDTYSINRYMENYLFSDSEADETICSMKQTTYLACMIGSFMVNLFTNHVANLTNPAIPYDLPFFTEYDAQNMLFKTEH